MLSRYRLFRVGLAVCLAVAGLGQGPGPNAAGAAPLAVETPAPEAAERAQAFAALEAKAAAGPVLVIVGLRLPTADSPVLPLTLEAERAAIARAQEAVDGVLAAAGAGPARRYQTLPYVSTRVDAAGLAALRASPWVTGIEEDVLEFPTLAQSTLLIGASTPGTGAWARGFTGAGQVVAVLDTGVDRSHPFLAGKVVAEACYSNAGGFGTGEGGASLCPGGGSAVLGTGAAAPCALQGCDHGTHVAGIAAGKAYAGMNGGGPQFSGVAPDAQIIAIQVFTGFGTEVGTYSSDQIAALDYINDVLRLQFNVAAVNMSLGGPVPFSTPCDATQPGRKAAIDALRANGIATVIASGNGDQFGQGFPNGLSTPACISTAVSVGSTRDGGLGATPVDTISTFSNSASYLSLLAPGQWIQSSVPGGLFDIFQGTSMAAPHVAGAWAVLKQAQPTAGVAEVLTLLQNTGKPVTDPRNGFTQARIQLDALRFAGGNAYDFGRVTVDLSDQRVLTVQNPLVVPVTLTTLSLAGAGLSLAASTCPLGGALSAGGSCALTVTYAPTQTVMLNGMLSLAYTVAASATAKTLQATFAGQGVELCADNLVNNAVFERLDASWVQTDTVQGAALPLCPPGGCPLGGFAPAGPHSGLGWALFGAYTDTVTTTTTITQVLTQSVVVPTDTVSVQFMLSISRADPGAGSADVFEAWLDNTRIFSATAAQRASYADYQTVRLSWPAAPQVLTRTLTFSATTQRTGPVVIFNLDDVALCSPAFFPIYLPVIGQGQ